MPHTDPLTPLTHQETAEGWWQPRRDRPVPAAAKVTFPDWPGTRVVVFWRELVDGRYRYFVNGERVQPAEFRASWERECPGVKFVWDFDDERVRVDPEIEPVWEYVSPEKPDRPFHWHGGPGKWKRVE